MKTERLPNGNLIWLDIARGISAFLVVLLHTSTWYGERVMPNSQIIWQDVSEIFRPMRLPMFFFVSGMLSISMLQRNFRENGKRTIGLFLLHVFWASVFLAMHCGSRWMTGEAQPPVMQLILAPVLPTALWYIWALPVYHSLAWLLNRALGRGAILVLGPSFLLAALAPFLPEGPLRMEPPLERLMFEDVLSNSIWFFAGIHLRDLCLTIYAQATRMRLLLAGALYFACVGMAMHWQMIEVLKVFLAPVALLVVVQGLALMNFDSRFARFLIYLGRQTLPIYVFHFFALSIGAQIVLRLGLPSLFAQAPKAAGFILVPLLTLLIVIGCRKIGARLEHSAFAFLIMPRRLWPAPRQRHAIPPP